MKAKTVRKMSHTQLEELGYVISWGSSAYQPSISRDGHLIWSGQTKQAWSIPYESRQNIIFDLEDRGLLPR